MKALVSLVLLLVLTAGCRTSANQPDDAELATLEAPEYEGYIFIGCRVNAGECQNSCAARIIRAMSGESDYCNKMGGKLPDGRPQVYECHCAVDETEDPPKKPEY